MGASRELGRSVSNDTWQGLATASTGAGTSGSVADGTDRSHRDSSAAAARTPSTRSSASAESAASSGSSSSSGSTALQSQRSTTSSRASTASQRSDAALNTGLINAPQRKRPKSTRSAALRAGDVTVSEGLVLPPVPGAMPPVPTLVRGNTASPPKSLHHKPAHNGSHEKMLELRVKHRYNKQGELALWQRCIVHCTLPWEYMYSATIL